MGAIWQLGGLELAPAVETDLVEACVVRTPRDASGFARATKDRTKWDSPPGIGGHDPLAR